MMILKKMLILLICLPALWSCRQKPTTINIAGSTTVLPIVQAAAEVYMDKNPTINISVRGGGSGIGIKSAISRTIDIGSASRQIDDREQELTAAQQIDLIETAIAKDAISIVVNKTNPIEDISMEDLKAIYSGEITNWQQLGGADKTIVVISRDFASGSFSVFNEAVLDSVFVKENSMRLASNNAVATTVRYTPGAIGYIGLGYINNQLKTLSVNGVFPTNKTAVDDEYELCRLLYMYSSDSPRKLAQDFIDFILSDEGQKIVEEQGYVRIK